MERIISSEKCHYEFIIIKDKNTGKDKLHVMLHFEGNVYKNISSFSNLINFLQSIGLEQYRADNNVKFLWFYKKNAEVDIFSFKNDPTVLKSISDQINVALVNLDKLICG